MFKVDLLKGQGIPVRFRPESAATIAVMIVVPAVVGLAIVGLYLHNSIVISIQNYRLVSYDDKEDRLAVATQLQKKLSKDKIQYNSCLAEVGKSLERHTQWSDTIKTVVQSIPSSVILKEMKVKQRSIKTKVPKEGDPKRMITISVPVRTLHMSVSSRAEADSDKAVKDFRNRLWASEVMGPKLENIEVSQQQDTVDGHEVVSYEISCIFKLEI